MTAVLAPTCPDCIKHRRQLGLARQLTHYRAQLAATLVRVVRAEFDRDLAEAHEIQAARERDAAVERAQRERDAAIDRAERAQRNFERLWTRRAIDAGIDTEVVVPMIPRQRTTDRFQRHAI